ncbi:MAG: hypothetical protein ABI697_02830 [Devosia sp.]
MDFDLTSQAVSMISARTQTLVQIAVLRKSQQMQQDLLETLGVATPRTAPAAGQGRLVDKTA